MCFWGCKSINALKYAFRRLWCTASLGSHIHQLSEKLLLYWLGYFFLSNACTTFSYETFLINDKTTADSVIFLLNIYHVENIILKDIECKYLISKFLFYFSKLFSSGWRLDTFGITYKTHEKKLCLFTSLYYCRQWLFTMLFFVKICFIHRIFVSM